MNGTKEKGGVGEILAQEYLVAHGFDLLEANYRFHQGEIDIVAREGECLVFCEVKTRWTDAYGAPECAVTSRKQAQIRRVAEAYCVMNDIRDQACRFDVVAIRMDRSRPVVTHIRNAF